MPYFEYEAMLNGKIKGIIEGNTAEEIIEKLNKMGATNIKIKIKVLHKKDYNYTAKDSGGNKVKGVIKGVDKFQLGDKISELENMGYKDFIVQETSLSQIKSFFSFKK